MARRTTNMLHNNVRMTAEINEFSVFPKHCQSRSRCIVTYVYTVVATLHSIDSTCHIQISIGYQ